MYIHFVFFCSQQLGTLSFRRHQAQLAMTRSSNTPGYTTSITLYQTSIRGHLPHVIPWNNQTHFWGQGKPFTHNMGKRTQSWHPSEAKSHAKRCISLDDSWAEGLESPDPRAQPTKETGNARPIDFQFEREVQEIVGNRKRIKIEHTGSG